MPWMLSIVVGCLIGFWVWAHIFVVIGPICAFLMFITGRFFISSVLMSAALFSAAKVVWPDDPQWMQVDAEYYKVLLGTGLTLEAAKYVFKILWRMRQWEVTESTEIDNRPDIHLDLTNTTATGDDLFKIVMGAMSKGYGVKFDVVEEPEMKDVTPRRKLLTGPGPVRLAGRGLAGGLSGRITRHDD